MSINNLPIPSNICMRADFFGTTRSSFFRFEDRDGRTRFLQRCPHCLKISEFEFGPHCQFKHFLCSSCPEFLLIDTAEGYIERRSVDISFLPKLRRDAPKGKIALIKLCVNPLGLEDEHCDRAILWR